MRHQTAGLTLSRTTEHRKALFSNLVAALFQHERIKTTAAKAKQTKRLAERTITWARRLGEILTKTPEKRSSEESAKFVHAVRMARRIVRDRDALSKLFGEIGPRFLGRAGGYTRIVKVGQRPGDAAPMSILELMPDESAAKKTPGAAGKTAGAKSKAAGESPVVKTAAEPVKRSAKKAEAADVAEGAEKPKAKRAKAEKADKK